MNSSRVGILPARPDIDNGQEPIPPTGSTVLCCLLPLASCLLPLLCSLFPIPDSRFPIPDSRLNTAISIFSESIDDYYSFCKS
ncbi:MAG: hypothetical protein F6K26_33155 [Moorea sp. SIO2I5]|nr:hypothetical protein [Moorena sp. SIO2I5]